MDQLDGGNDVDDLLLSPAFLLDQPGVIVICCFPEVVEHSNTGSSGEDETLDLGI